jgi:endonuclease/exonuclease/phosphatase family metal-dependent hydrolase
MKLITLNVWEGRISRKIVPFFQKYPADIVCLQELNRAKETIPLWDVYDVYDNIKTATGLPYEYFSPTVRYKIMDIDAEFGNGIFTNKQIAKKSTVFVNGQENYVTTPDDYVTNTRNAQIVELNIGKGRITIVNHHGYWEPNGMGSSISVEKLELLSEHLQEVDGPLIVVGDFNVSSKSEAINKFKQKLGLVDLTESHNLGSTLSSDVTPYKVDCDHIFVSKHIKVKQIGLLDELVSDHKAIMLDFDII